MSRTRWDRELSDLVYALRDALDADGMTIRRAGDIVGVTGQTVQNWAKGTASVTLNAHTQQGLAALLEVSPRDVLTLAGFDLGPDTGPLSSRASGGYRSSALSLVYSDAA